MNAFELILVAAGIPAFACSLYLLTLTALSLRPNTPARGGAETTRFRIVVPAHNEEQGIARTLWALRHTNYPPTRHEFIVVADNCTDATAQVARECGARVLVRNDPDRRGKGYALQFAFDELCKEQAQAWDAVVVVDADTLVEPNILSAFDHRLSRGETVVQAAYLPAASPRNPLSVITDVAFTAMHLVRSTARERLGLSVGLRGNGMAFSRAVVSTVPHAAFSRTEDLEFGLELARRGHRVSFASETTVFGDMPQDETSAVVQRSRWIGGRVEMARAHGAALMGAAIRQRSAMLADLAIDLIVPPVSLILVMLTIGTALAALTSVLTGAVSPALLVWLSACAALGVHVLDAARRAGRIRALFGAPFALLLYAADKSRIVIRSFRSTDREWVRTARPGEAR